MGFSHERRDLALLASGNQSSDRVEPHNSALSLQSRPIEVSGVYLGATVAHELGVRFLSADERVAEMNASIWPNFDYARNAARQMFRSNWLFTSSFGGRRGHRS